MATIAVPRAPNARKPSDAIQRVFDSIPEKKPRNRYTPKAMPRLANVAFTIGDQTVRAVALMQPNVEVYGAPQRSL